MVINNIKMHKAMYEFYKYVFMIQKKVRNQLSTRHSKVEVLVNYWDKMLGQI